jgi:hypothetical protein
MVDRPQTDNESCTALIRAALYLANNSSSSSSKSLSLSSLSDPYHQCHSMIVSNGTNAWLRACGYVWVMVDSDGMKRYKHVSFSVFSFLRPLVLVFQLEVDHQRLSFPFDVIMLFADAFVLTPISPIRSFIHLS